MDGHELMSTAEREAFFWEAEDYLRRHRMADELRQFHPEYCHYMSLLREAWTKVVRLIASCHLQFSYQNGRPLLVQWERLEEIGLTIGRAMVRVELEEWGQASWMIDNLMSSSHSYILVNPWQVVHTWPPGYDKELVTARRDLYVSLCLLRHSPMSRFARDEVMATD